MWMANDEEKKRGSGGAWRPANQARSPEVMKVMKNNQM